VVKREVDGKKVDKPKQEIMRILSSLFLKLKRRSNNTFFY